jgi:hypothetical protein
VHQIFVRNKRKLSLSAEGPFVILQFGGIPKMKELSYALAAKFSEFTFQVMEVEDSARFGWTF